MAAKGYALGLCNLCFDLRYVRTENRVTMCAECNRKCAESIAFLTWRAKQHRESPQGRRETFRVVKRGE